MNQTGLPLPRSLTWHDDPFWGAVSDCGTYAIRPISVNGRAEFVLWRFRRDTKTGIPNCLGTFESSQKALESII